jgi:glutathione synthase/RimK-type ligase-like ATP-grasp enzyme
MFDVTLITDSRYVNPAEINWYIQNILDDDKLVTEALQKRGLSVTRTNWDNPTFDWTKTRYAIFRTTWDYFDRFAEFSPWLKKVSTQTHLVNPIETIWWNIDKHYLLDLSNQGIPTPPTVFIEQGDSRLLSEIVKQSGWANSILKPAVSGSARHTYKLDVSNIESHETIFKQLIKEESMLLQEFQHQITTKGEVALMVFGGKYSHAVLKKAKQGDFRVQDDFGGSVHEYTPTKEEIKFAEDATSKVKPLPVYARVDVIWDNEDNLCVSELELIEPELWFRKHPPSAEMFAEAVINKIEPNK